MSILGDARKYLPRVIDAEIEKELSENGAIRIYGPRQCGKTWTASYHGASGFFPQDPELASERALTGDRLSGILKGEKPRVLDEWQDVDGLWDAVVFDLDRSGEYGQYILTGSVSPKAMKDRRMKLGRIKKLRMDTMSLYETGDSSGDVSLRDLCEGRLTPCATGEVKIERLVRLMARGGWPRPSDTNADPSTRAIEYISSIIDDDVPNLGDDSYNTEDMWSLVRSLARNEAGTPSMDTLLKDVYGVGAKDPAVLDANVRTIEKYLNFLDRYHLFGYTRSCSFSPNPCSRGHVGNVRTRYFCDVSLACSLLGIGPAFDPETATDDDYATLGHLFESLCVHDLWVYAQSFGAEVYHYRENRNTAGRGGAEKSPDIGSRKKDGANNGLDDEIDAVIRLSDKRTCAFEIKLSREKVDKASEDLLRISENIERGGGTPPSVLCVVCGTEDRAYRRGDGVFVVPITALKP